MTTSGNNKRIAFIENDKFLYLAYKYGLEKEGYEVFVVSTTEPGFIEAMVEFKPSIIILDLIIQPTDGFTVLEELRKNSNFTTVSIIVFSNLKQESDLKKCFELGANDYLIKTSTDRKQFIEKIENYLEPVQQS